MYGRARRPVPELPHLATAIVMGVTDTAGHAEAREGQVHLWESRGVRWSAVSGLLLAIGFVAERAGADGRWATLVYVAATLAGMRFFALEALQELRDEREVGIELLMTVAAFAAGGLGLWGEAATLAFLYSISESLEEFTQDRTRGAIRALMDLAPKRVIRLVDGREEEIALNELGVGERFLVRPGQAVATDGTAIEGRSAVNEAPITGESVPVDKEVGDRVFAGTLNTTGALVVEATATVADNTLAKIVHLVTQAQEQKGRGEQFMTRFARKYSPAVLLTGVAVVIIGGVATGDWPTWAERAATVVVAAAPCALVISIPISYVAAIGNAGRKGILIKGGVYLEELAQVTVLALDKTGTITQGQPRLVDIAPVGDRDRDDIVRLAAAVEARSEHPLARAVVAYAEEASLAFVAAADFEALTGAGARPCRWLGCGRRVTDTHAPPRRRPRRPHRDRAASPGCGAHSGRRGHERRSVGSVGHRRRRPAPGQGGHGRPPPRRAPTFGDAHRRQLDHRADDRRRGRRR